MRRTLRAVLAVVLLPLVAALTLLAPQPAAAASLTRSPASGPTPPTSTCTSTCPTTWRPSPPCWSWSTTAADPPAASSAATGTTTSPPPTGTATSSCCPRPPASGQLLRRLVTRGAQARRRQRLHRHHVDGRLRPSALQRRPGPHRRQRLLLRRHDDQRPGRRVPRCVHRRLGVLRGAGRLLRHHATAPSGTASAPAATSSRPPSSGATWPAPCTPATPAATRACRCGTAPPTPPWPTPTSARRSSSGPTSTALSQTPASTDHPQSTWTRTRYGGTGTQPPSRASASRARATPCRMTGMLAYAITFLGLDGARHDASAAQHLRCAARGGREQVPGRAERVADGGYAAADPGLPGRGRPALDPYRVRAVDGDHLGDHLVSGRLQPPDHLRHQGGDLVVQRRGQPAVEPQRRRDRHRRPVRPVPGRHRRLHRQRRQVQLWTCSGGTNQKWNLS